MEKKLLPIGTKVYIRDDSEYFEQGVSGGKKVIGEVTDHLNNRYTDEYDYLYEVTWTKHDINTYKPVDIEPVEPIERDKSEEEINNELKQLFNKILNN
jgi:hypothetical protein